MMLDYQTHQGEAVTETERMMVMGEAWLTFWDLADWHEALDTLAEFN